MSRCRFFTVALIGALLASFAAPVSARALPALRIVTPAYTLDCTPQMRGTKMQLDCVPSRTPKPEAKNLFGAWKYGDPIPYAILAQVTGNGAPAVCDGTTIVCQNGVVALNASGTLAASSTLCTNGSSQITTTGCPGGGGDTITSPNGTISIGGTSTATTLDVNTATTREFTAQQHFVGAGGANACAGANYPTTVYGACYGGNNGTTNIDAIVIGPQKADFACTASCVAGDSARIRFYDSTTTGALSACDIHYNQSIGAINPTCAMFLSGRLITAANATGGTCSIGTGTTSCTVTLSHTFGAPVCTTGVNTATPANVIQPPAWSVSGTTLTLTVASAPAAATTVSGWCWGNGS